MTLDDLFKRSTPSPRPDAGVTATFYVDSAAGSLDALDVESIGTALDRLAEATTPAEPAPQQ